MTKSSDIAGQTTGIGSLPRGGEKEVLDQAFALDIPYFPTLPTLGGNETLIGQGLAGFGEEPTTDFSPGLLWRPYLERLAQDPRPWAKLQLVGPVTASQSLSDPGLSEGLAAWLIHRAVSMLAEVQKLGKKVLLVLDEPAWSFGEEDSGLRSTLEILGAENAVVGLHCCAGVDLSPLLEWPLDFLSFDFSLASPWEDVERLRSFRHRGGRLALGVVPTAVTSAWHPPKEVERCRSRLRAALGAAEAEEVLRESLLTPACGLGLRSPEESAAVYAALKEFQHEVYRS